MDSVAVVILNYNGKEYLQKFLPGVIRFSYGYKIVIGDNGSTDGSVAFIKEHFPSVQIICLPRNEGYSKGYNLVLQQVNARYYILLNSDVEVTEGWIPPVISLMEDDPSIAACQPKILSYYQKDSFEYAGAAGGFIDLLGYPFCRGRIFDTVEKDNGQYDDIARIFWATGACLFIRAEVFHEFGGFDDYFFAHMEEIDLCWRLNKAGYKIMYQGNSKVYHIGGGTLPIANPRKMFLNFRNSLFMLYKNIPQKQRIFIFFLRAVSDCIAALKFLISGKWKYVKAILKAYSAFLTNYKNIKKEDARKENNTSLKTMPVYDGSIIVAYFVWKKKIFSELAFKNTIKGYFFSLGVF